jgi:hypothetical protein
MYGDLALSGKVTAAGTLTITIKPTGRQTWTVNQVSISMTTAPIGATCYLKKNGVIVTPMVASGDAAGGDPPVVVRLVDKLTVEWAGCTSGVVGTVLVIYDDGQAN